MLVYASIFSIRSSPYYEQWLMTPEFLFFKPTAWAKIGVIIQSSPTVAKITRSTMQTRQSTEAVWQENNVEKDVHDHLYFEIHFSWITFMNIQEHVSGFWGHQWFQTKHQICWDNASVTRYARWTKSVWCHIDLAAGRLGKSHRPERDLWSLHRMFTQPGLNTQPRCFL